MLTKSEKDMWLAKLRDPSVTQTFENYGNIDANIGSICTCGVGCLWVVVSKDRREELIHIDDFWVNIRAEVVFLNDKNKFTFPQIADWVEKNVPCSD